jgi:8-oxo-dGTP pyrophosphatase MutT (NUDIX family)
VTGTLANHLRKALELGQTRSPELIPGDPLEPGVAASPPVAAAVLVPVVDRPHPTVIFTERPSTMRRHAGQVAFPGGRIDPGDAGPVAAALREAWEEIALPPASVEIVGIADRYRTITGFEVTPVLAVVPPDLPLVAQPGEVAAIFETPLDHILDPANQIVRTMEWRGHPREFYEILWQGRRIWGATAAMIVNLGRRLALTA